LVVVGDCGGEDVEVGAVLAEGEEVGEGEVPSLINASAERCGRERCHHLLTDTLNLEKTAETLAN